MTWKPGATPPSVFLATTFRGEDGTIGVMEYRVGVPEDSWLGLYFWLRLGYRSTRVGENLWPGRRPRDIIAMIRMSENPQPRA